MSSVDAFKLTMRRTGTYDGMASFPVIAAGISTESSILGSLASRAGDDSGDRLVIRSIVEGSVPARPNAGD